MKHGGGDGGDAGDGPLGNSAETRSAAAGRGGFTLVEALVSLLLLGALLQLCWGIAAAQRRGLQRMVARSDVLGAERAVWWVLSSETAAGTAARDWTVAGADVLALRAFRGRGVVCRGMFHPEGWVDVRYRGWRLAEPAKDSVLTLDRDGGWTARDLAGRDGASTGCTARPGERVERWRLDPPPSSPVVLARLFERGSYHMEDRSFRYRRGAAGRQPLTPEVVDASWSGLAAGPAGGVRVRFRGVAGLDREGSVPDSGWTRVLRGGS